MSKDDHQREVRVPLLAEEEAQQPDGAGLAQLSRVLSSEIFTMDLGFERLGLRLRDKGRKEVRGNRSGASSSQDVELCLCSNR
jgi:hypothetical protein